MQAYALLQQLRNGQTDEATKARFNEVKDDLGYGLLLKKYTPNVVDATEAQIRMAVDDTIPQVAPLFWSFRLMVALGFWFIVLFGLSFLYCAKRDAGRKQWLLRAALYSAPRRGGHADGRRCGIEPAADAETLGLTTGDTGSTGR